MMLSKEYHWHLIAKSKDEIDFGKYDIIQIGIADKTNDSVSSGFTR